jgi:hypothetical protein
MGISGRLLSPAGLRAIWNPLCRQEQPELPFAGSLRVIDSSQHCVLSVFGTSAF